MNDSEALAVRNLTVNFGGLLAVNDISLEAPVNRLTGLIGPNGAGKTTIFNVCSGLLRSSSGTVTLFGRDVSSRPPEVRARLGLGRTFQRMELFERLTVEENVVLGREALVAGRALISKIWESRSEHAEIRRCADRAIELCGLRELLNRPVGLLSTAERRLVEVARVVAGGFRLLLLDEPSSGLDVFETQRIGRILRQLVADGLGIVLVEHDMSLVRTICEYVYVLDFGLVIAQGAISEVLDSRVVRAAYLGAEVA
jgi:ABC-type branched-subunit amino acid transport system ATPase component